jgi:aryl-alcohol dehydrogenase-like predicted oxidoreductase
MEYRQLGRSGVRVSVIGIGANRFGADMLPQEDVTKIIDAAQDIGINHLDSADVYTGGRSEETIGIGLKGRRDRFFIASKVFWKVGEGPNDQGASRQHIMVGIEASLRRLQTAYIDLYYLHRWDDKTPIEESLRALDDLIRAGKVRYIGCSNYAAWQLAHANLLAEVKGWTAFSAIQSEYNLLERSKEREVLPYCRAHGVGFVPYFPLAGGFLTGKYSRGQPAPAGSRGESSAYVKGFMKDQNYDRIEKLEHFAKERDRGLNELAISWLLAQPMVCSVIAGATRLEHVQANVKAADWALSADELEAVNTVLSENDLSNNS